MNYKILKKHKSFSGKTLFCEHESESTKTKMKFSCHLPCPADQVEKALVWLSGLTCNEENFITKSFIQKHLEGSKTMVICPDTSPRGLDLMGEHRDYDFGSGASFYVNAITDEYKNNYQMYDYIVKDIVTLLKEDFNVSKLGIFGHSMGGHGALMIGLKEPDTFETVSAFSPIVNPLQAPWGQKAFSGYLGSDQDVWKDYDSTEIVKANKALNKTLLVDQGTSDEFLERELLTAHLENACKESGQSLKVNYREGYDHSYYFISTFLKEHVEHHNKG